MKQFQTCVKISVGFKMILIIVYMMKTPFIAFQFSQCFQSRNIEAVNNFWLKTHIASWSFILFLYLKVCLKIRNVLYNFSVSLFRISFKKLRNVHCVEWLWYYVVLSVVLCGSVCGTIWFYVWYYVTAWSV